MSQDIPIDILLGLDLGKSQHHACALDKNGIKVSTSRFPNSNQSQQHSSMTFRLTAQF